LWPTPTKSLYCNRIELELVDSFFRMRNDPTQQGSQLALGKAARLWTQIWLLMKACGARPTKPFRFPYSRALHLNLNAGPRSSINDLTFNPSFSDWIMGWPIGWADPMRPVTGWSHWLQRMRGELLKMPIWKGARNNPDNTSASLPKNYLATIPTLLRIAWSVGLSFSISLMKSA
jgi:hypothetical protein